MELPKLRHDIYLIGDVDIHIYGNKLPSKLQCLKVLFFYLRVVKKTVDESVASVIEEVLLFWRKAEIPTQHLSRCKQKLKDLYTEWQVLSKHKGRNIEKEQQFSNSLKKLFDIAHGDVFSLIDEEKKQFLMNQRSDTRDGYIAYIVTAYDVEQEEKHSSSSQTVSSATLNTTGQSIEPMSSHLSEMSLSSGDLFDVKTGPSNPKKSRGRINIMTEDLVANLDRFNVTDRQAFFIITAVCKALYEKNLISVSIDDLIINRSSFRRHRQNIREMKFERMRKEFSDLSLTSCVIHWDGKLLPNILNTKTVDRLPIVLNSGNKECLLGVPEIDNGTGKAQALAIYETLHDWGLCDTIKAICCDTTAANLGRVNGAATQLEALLDTDLLYLPCRHHVFELVLRSVFEKHFPVTVGPNVPLFKNFQSAWNDINTSNYVSGMEDEIVKEHLCERSDNIKQTVSELLKQTFPRNDYREFLELVLVFLGVVPENHCFKRPGAFHHARWMSKAIYALKIYLFRTEFKLKKTEVDKLRNICIFIVVVYVKAWFKAPMACKSPNNDLEFLKLLENYRVINDSLAEVALKKFANHLWYLSPELVMLSVFDDEVPVAVKSKIIEKLRMYEKSKDETSDDVTKTSNTKRYEIHQVGEILNKDIDYFVTPQSLNFFNRFGLSTAFFEIPISEWKENEHYLNALNFVENLKVVNDCAERAVKLMEDYNGKFTKNEQQQQYILQIIKEYRERQPIDARRIDL